MRPPQCAALHSPGFALGLRNPNKARVLVLCLCCATAAGCDRTVILITQRFPPSNTLSRPPQPRTAACQPSCPPVLSCQQPLSRSPSVGLLFPPVFQQWEVCRLVVPAAWSNYLYFIMLIGTPAASQQNSTAAHEPPAQVGRNSRLYTGEMLQVLRSLPLGGEFQFLRRIPRQKSQSAPLSPQII